MLQILKAPEFIAPLLVGIVVIVTFLYVKNLGYSEKEREVLIDNVSILEKRNEIANNRPDVVAVIASLRNGEF